MSHRAQYLLIRSRIFAWTLMLIINSWVFFSLCRHSLLADEVNYFYQISKFLNNDFSLFKDISAWPTYHAIIALCLKVLPNPSFVEARFFSFVISLISVLAFYWAAKRMDNSSALSRTAQYNFFPILFPYFFLLYTEPLSLLFFWLALFFLQKNNYTATALFGTASLLVRQTHILWLAFLFVLLYLSQYGLYWVWPKVKNHLIKSWLFLVIASGFLLFVFLNKGVAVGDRQQQAFNAAHLGNIYFILFTFFWMFLPLNLANAKKIMNDLYENPWLFLGLAFFGVFFYLTFVNDHPYNQSDRIWYFRNRCLLFFSGSVWKKMFFFGFIAYAVLSIRVTPLRQRAHYILYPFTLLFLMPSWLIEHRYYFIPLILFNLFRESKSRAFEWATVGYYLVVSIVFIHFISRSLSFL